MSETSLPEARRDALVRNLKAEMKRQRLSARGLSLKAGLSESAVKHILRGNSKHPRMDTLSALASGLGTTPQQLVEGYGPGFSEREPDLVTETSVVEVKPSAGLVPTLARDVPIFGAIEAGTEGAFNLNQTALAYAPRLPALVGTGAFAFHPVDEAMAPRFRQSDLVFVDPARPCRPGDHVIFELREETRRPPRYLFRIFESGDREGYGISLYGRPVTPGRGHGKLAKDAVRRILRVLDWPELLAA